SPRTIRPTSSRLPMTHHMTTRTICRATKYLVAAPTRNDGSNGATDRLDQIATESARDYHHCQHARRTNGPILKLLAPGGPQVGVTALGDHQCCASGNSGLCRRIELIIIGDCGGQGEVLADCAGENMGLLGDRDDPVRVNGVDDVPGRRLINTGD